MTNTKLIDIISCHKNWIHKGYSFDDILSIQGELKDVDPFKYTGTKEIQANIEGQVFPNPETGDDSDYSKIKYIVVEDIDFDGNIDFLERCINIEQLNISGVCCEGKINGLQPLEKLTKLNYIDFHSHSISDVSSLSKLEKLETLILWGNPIKSIKPIVHLKNLKNVQFSVVEEGELFELLKNSTDATVTYVSTENDESYKAVWINNWAFRTKRYKDVNTISITVEPLLITDFVNEFRTSGIDYISLMRQKSENIALSLHRDTYEMVGSTEDLCEDVRFLKVFEYKLK
jgi:hypothetical protein